MISGEAMGNANNRNSSVDTNNSANNALRLLNEETQAIANLGRVINSTSDINEVYEIVAIEAKKLVHFDRINIVLIDHELGNVTLKYQSGLTVAGREVGFKFPLEGQQVQRITAASQTAIRADISKTSELDADQVLLDAGLRSSARIPLIVKGRVIGTLGLFSCDVGNYGPREQSIIERIADQIAPAVENAQLYERFQANVAEMAVVDEVARILTSTLDIDQAYEQFAAEVRKLVNFDGVVLSGIDLPNRSVVLRYTSGLEIPGGQIGNRYPLEGSIAEQLISTRETIVRTNLTDSVKFGEIDQRRDDLGIKSMIAVPLISGNRTIAVLSLLSQSFDSYDARDQRILERLASQIAPAIDNARLYDESQQTETENLVVAEIGRVIGSSLNIDMIYDQFGQQVAKLIPFDRIGVALVDQTDGFGQTMYVSGTDVEGRRPGDRFSLAGTLAGDVAETWTPKMLVATEEIEIRDMYPGLVPDFRSGLRSIIGVPLIDHDVVFGVLQLRSKTPNIYNQHHLELTQRIGNQIAGAIANAQLYAERLRTEAELIRTMAELSRSNDELEQFAHIASHDLQEPLRMVSSYTQLLGKRYKGRLDSDADEFIGYAVDGAKRMQNRIADLLAYSRVTRVTSFEETDSSDIFETAVANLAAGIVETGAVVTRDSLPTLPADRSQLTSVFQNLIGNAIKYHGERPPIVHVSAEATEGQWLFTFKDNGIGIDAEFAERIFVLFQRLHSNTAYPGTGIGLAICKKVVEQHGGRIWVESEPGQSSTFCVTLPMLAEETNRAAARVVEKADSLPEFSPTH
jgi:signal transduction histidine kinase